MPALVYRLSYSRFSDTLRAPSNMARFSSLHRPSLLTDDINTQYHGNHHAVFCTLGNICREFCLRPQILPMSEGRGFMCRCPRCAATVSFTQLPPDLMGRQCGKWCWAVQHGRHTCAFVRAKMAARREGPPSR